MERPHAIGPSARMLLRAAAAGLLLLGVLGVAAPDIARGEEPAPVVIEVLSNRADLVSGGAALVSITLPPRVVDDAVRVEVEGRDVTTAFESRADGTFAGVVTGLASGENVLTTRLDDGSGATITITNHPAAGPVLSGPQITPWLCQTAESGLGEPVDATCHAETPRADLFYRSTLTGGFETYDPESPPAGAEVARTTTDEGREVPYIVQRERGTLNRGIYEVAVLHDPEEAWDPGAPQAGWNGKLLYKFGGGCAPNHRQGTAAEMPDVLDGTALSRGFAVATSTLNVLDLSCNDVVSAETVMMLKEHIRRTYGPIRYTIGDGESGGAIQQHLIAANYPGLLDGLRPALSYPDIWSITDELLDCELLLRHFSETSPLLWANPLQQGAVTGHLSVSACHAWVNLFGFPRSVLDPTVGCAGTPLLNTLGGQPAQIGAEYHPENNPDGVRCTLQDFQRSLLGTDPLTGAAGRAWDNVGVQYGLEALLDGTITAAQFVDLNAGIGGVDLDFGFTEERTSADPLALERLHRSGRLPHVGALADVPIVDFRHTSNVEIHTDFHTWSMRERLLRDNGHADNHVAWVGLTGLQGPMRERSLLLIDRWLAGIEADDGAEPLATKVARHRPDDAVDACWVERGMLTAEDACDALFPYFANPRIAAGLPLAGDTVKCALRPIDWAADYPGVAFTAEERTALEATFPDGVCDPSAPGVARATAPATWLTFAEGPGGRPLGPAPTSRPFGPDRPAAPAAAGGPPPAAAPAPAPSGARLPATGGGAGGVALLLLAVAVTTRRGGLRFARRAPATGDRAPVR
jgi:hypothetical protein